MDTSSPHTTKVNIKSSPSTCCLSFFPHREENVVRRWELTTRRATEETVSYVTLRVSLLHNRYQTLGQQFQIMSEGNFVKTDNIILVDLKWNMALSWCQNRARPFTGREAPRFKRSCCYLLMEVLCSMQRGCKCHVKLFLSKEEVFFHWLYLYLHAQFQDGTCPSSPRLHNCDDYRRSDRGCGRIALAVRLR